MSDTSFLMLAFGFIFLLAQSLTIVFVLIIAKRTRNGGLTVDREELRDVMNDFGLHAKEIIAALAKAKKR